MNCRNCRTKMNYQTDGDFFSCVCGINTPAGWRKVSAIATSISIDIPYDPPPKTSPTRTQKIIENKLKERREWLEFRCITEHDIVVEDGGEYFILPDLKGNRQARSTRETHKSSLSLNKRPDTLSSL